MLSPTEKHTVSNIRLHQLPLRLPDQSAHRDSVPVLVKGPTEPIIILFQAGKWRQLCFIRGGCTVYRSLAAISAFRVRAARREKLLSTHTAEFLLRLYSSYSHNYYCQFAQSVVGVVLSWNLGWDPARYDPTGLTRCLIPITPKTHSLCSRVQRVR